MKTQGNLQKILKIAIPITLGNIINQVQMLTDRAFLGHVNPLYMSALGNVSTPIWTSMSVCFSITAGASIIISQKVGAKQTDEYKNYSAALLKWINILPVMLFFFWLFCGKFIFLKMGVSENVLPMCTEYLTFFLPNFLVVGLEAATMVIMQTSNHTKPLVYFGMVRSLANVLLDWVMIFGKWGCPAMGIKGAAIATVISEYIGFFFATVVFVKSKKLFTRPSLKAIIASPIGPFLKSAKLGVNTALEDFMWNFGNIAMIAILNTINEGAAGIYSMIFGVEILVVVVIGAIGNATMTLSGEATGACDRERFFGVCRDATLLSMVCSVAMLLCCVFIPEKIIGLFTNDTTIISSCGLYLILMSLNLFSKSGNIIFGNAIRGNGDPAWMFKTQIFGTFFVIACALLFVRVLGLGIAGVFFAVMSDEFVRALVNYLRVRYVIKKI